MCAGTEDGQVEALPGSSQGDTVGEVGDGIADIGQVTIGYLSVAVEIDREDDLLRGRGKPRRGAQREQRVGNRYFPVAVGVVAKPSASFVTVSRFIVAGIVIRPSAMSHHPLFVYFE